MNDFQELAQSCSVSFISSLLPVLVYRQQFQRVGVRILFSGYTLLLAAAAAGHRHERGRRPVPHLCPAARVRALFTGLSGLVGFGLQLNCKLSAHCRASECHVFCCHFDNLNADAAPAILMHSCSSPLLSVLSTILCPSELTGTICPPDSPIVGAYNYVQSGP